MTPSSFPTSTLGLYKVSANGGTPEPLTFPDAAMEEVRHFAPQILPGGRDVLFTILSNKGLRTAILSLASNEWRTVLDNSESARYVDTGHLVYAQSAALLAVGLDLAGLDTRGSPVPIPERVSHVAGLGGAHFAVSGTGTLVYQAAQPNLNITMPGSVFIEMLNSLVWSDRNKALLVLLSLTERRDAALLDQLRATAARSLVDMAKWKSRHSSVPYVLLGRLSGLPETTIIESWERGDRDTILIKVR